MYHHQGRYQHLGPQIYSWAFYEYRMVINSECWNIIIDENMKEVPSSFPGSSSVKLTHDFCHVDSDNSDDVYTKRREGGSQRGGCVWVGVGGPQPSSITSVSRREAKPTRQTNNPKPRERKETKHTRKTKQTQEKAREGREETAQAKKTDACSFIGVLRGSGSSKGKYVSAGARGT